MLNVQEASALITKTIRRNPVVEIKLGDSLGMILAQRVRSKEPSPRFDASSVDGYAISVQSFEHFSSELQLPIAAEIQAGDNVLRKLAAGKTMRIFTGGRVPTGADAVIMQEYVNRMDGKAYFTTKPRAEENVRRRGAEFLANTIIFEPGTLITPAVISTLAALGLKKVKVYQRSKISVIVSGDEVRSPGTKLQRGEIYDSNSYALTAALAAIGIMNVKTFHVKDDLKKTTATLQNALKVSDIIIVTGGVSVGEHDYVREALSNLGAEEIFWRVKVKPGKPLLFCEIPKKGKVNEKYIFGLPGNPVSVLVTFHLFVRNAILQTMGFIERDRSIIASLRSPLKKAAGRAEYIRGKLSFSINQLPSASPLREQESNMTSGLAHANCLIEFSEEETYLPEGTEVKTIPIQWSLF
jgi:molybdopterin molybdotransferase